MSFISVSFLMSFALLLAVYYLIPKRFQWMLLLAASLLFYASFGAKYLIYLGVTALSTWGAAYLMDVRYRAQDAYLKEHKGMAREEKKAYKAEVSRKAKRLLVACLLLNLGILAVIKYTNFALENWNAVFHTELAPVHFALPVGISFYMFQSLGYVIDVYRRKYPAERNLAKCALFTSFFPQVIQGPISRFDELSVSLFAEHPFDAQQVTFGLWRVIWGFFKKLVIADRLAPAVAALTAPDSSYTGVYVLAVILFYALQIYGDFTGGIDITIGLAQMLGVKVAENFNRPFFAKNIADYWRRWHITMGTWFRDYIFYSMSVSPRMLKLSKQVKTKISPELGKRLPVYLSTITVWLATGLWHGAAWHFIVWGMVNCVILLVSQELAPVYRKFHARFAWSNTKGWEVFQIFRTFWMMGMIRVLDVYRTPGLWASRLLSIFTAGNWGALTDGSFLKLGLDGADYLVVLVGSLILLAVSLAKGKGPVREQLAAKPAPVRILLIWALIAGALIFGAYGIGYDAAQFIYIQF